jgi:hypothetical protein
VTRPSLYVTNKRASTHSLAPAPYSRVVKSSEAPSPSKSCTSSEGGHETNCASVDGADQRGDDVPTCTAVNVARPASTSGS